MSDFDARREKSTNFATDGIAVLVHSHSTLQSEHILRIGGITSSSSGRIMSLRKLGGVAVNKFGPAVDLLGFLAGAVAAFSTFASFAGLG
jgi:hypothetical protein